MTQPTTASTSTGRRRSAPAIDVVAPAGADPALVLADWQTVRIRSALGMQLRQTSQVRLARPRWMPARLFRWLFRQIVIDVEPSPVDGSRVLATANADHRVRRPARARGRR